MEGPASSSARRGLFSKSVSFASTPGAATARVVSSAVAYESLLAVGGSLTAVTLTVTTATLEFS